MSEILIILGILMFCLWFVLLWEIGGITCTLHEIKEEIREMKKQKKEAER